MVDVDPEAATEASLRPCCLLSTRVVILELEDKAGSKADEACLHIRRTQPNHHIINLGVVSREDQVLEAGLLRKHCLVISGIELIDLLLHLGEGLTHDSRQHQVPGVLGEALRQVNFLHLQGVKPLLECESVVKLDSFEAHRSYCVRVIIKIVEVSAFVFLICHLQGCHHWLFEFVLHPEEFSPD